MSQYIEQLSVSLVEAVKQNDIDQAIALVHAGADPFLPCAPVEVYVINPGWNMRVGRGCAAIQAIRNTQMLEAILPKQMDALPIVTCATSIWGSVCRDGEDVCLGQWAIEAGAIDGLAAILSRLDRTTVSAQASLTRLLRMCARGCTTSETNDPVYASLLMLLAHRIDLGDDWGHLESVQLREPTVLTDGFWEYGNVPLVFVLVGQATSGMEQAVKGLNWLLEARPQWLGQTLSDPRGWTLLHWSAGLGSMRQIEFALQAGCDPDAPAADGRTAADVAMSHGKKDCAAMINSWCSSKVIEQIRKLGLNSPLEEAL